MVYLLLSDPTPGPSNDRVVDSETVLVARQHFLFALNSRATRSAVSGRGSSESLLMAIVGSVLVQPLAFAS